MHAHSANDSHPGLLQLRNGQLVMVPSVLVRRLKSHFLTLPCNVDIILGLNGYIWVSKHVKASEQEGEAGFDAEAVYSNQNDVRMFFLSSGFLSLSMQEIDASTRTAIARVANLIQIFASHFIPLTDTLLLEAYAWTVEQEGDVKSFAQEDYGDALVTAVAYRE